MKYVIIKNDTALPCILLHEKENRKHNTMWVGIEWIIQRQNLIFPGYMMWKFKN